MFNNEIGWPGSDGFVWFRGVVEDIFDPEQLGRVRVRVLGDHTQDLGAIPLENLPWAFVIMPPNSASVSGVGKSPTGIQKGSWVFGFYIDGPNRQQPIVTGSIGGLPITPPDSSIGFNDPDECYPFLINEPDTNRLARGESGGKYSASHPATDMRRELVESGELGVCGGTIEEPETPYDALYPYNQVWEGPYSPDCDGYDWGHIEEWDSTPGVERYLRWHKSSMNFLEIHPEGTEVHKIFGDNYEIDMANKKVIIKGDWEVVVEGNKKEHVVGDYCLHVEGNFNQFVDKDKNTTVGGNYTRDISGFEKETVGGDKISVLETNYIKTITENDVETIGGDKTSDITGVETKTVGGDRTKTVEGTDKTIAAIILEEAGEITYTVEGAFTIEAGSINLDGTVYVSTENITSFEETHTTDPVHFSGASPGSDFTVFTPGVI